jgi:hypothetical protein
LATARSDQPGDRWSKAASRRTGDEHGKAQEIEAAVSAQVAESTGAEDHGGHHEQVNEDGPTPDGVGGVDGPPTMVSGDSANAGDASKEAGGGIRERSLAVVSQRIGFEERAVNHVEAEDTETHETQQHRTGDEGCGSREEGSHTPRVRT